MQLSNENLIVIVLAHGKVADVVKRHLPVWQQWSAPVIFFTPTDDPLPESLGLEQYSRGKSKAYSADTNIRCRAALQYAAKTRAHYVLLCEYDSLVFGNIPHQHIPYPTDRSSRNAVAAPMFHNADSKFRGKTYLHFPQLYSMTAVQAVVAEMESMPADAEHGFTDRYVGLAVERAHTQVIDLNPTGFVYTQNEIDKAKLPEALAAYAKGARWSHGIKSAEVFSALRKASFE